MLCFFGVLIWISWLFLDGFSMPSKKFNGSAQGPFLIPVDGEERPSHGLAAADLAD